MRVDFSNRAIKKLDLKLLDELLNEIKRDNHEFRELLEEAEMEHMEQIDIKDYIEIILFDSNFISKLENLHLFVNLKRVRKYKTSNHSSYE
jgi:hypothetical protein